MSVEIAIDWHWSALTERGPSAASDAAGVVSAPSSKEALDTAARDVGCHAQPQRLRHWRSGGIAVYTNDRGDRVTLLVVVSKYIAVKWYSPEETSQLPSAAEQLIGS